MILTFLIIVLTTAEKSTISSTSFDSSSDSSSDLSSDSRSDVQNCEWQNYKPFPSMKTTDGVKQF